MARSLSNPLAGRSTASSLNNDLSLEYRRRAGAYIREKRLEKELTQEQLAELIGITYSVVSSIETGRASVPPERYEIIAEVLNIDPEEFGETMLRFTNPWAYKLIYGSRNRQLTQELASLQHRSSHLRGKPRSA